MLKNFFKIIFMAFMILVAVQGQSFAQKKVAILLDAPTGMFSEPEKVYDAIKETLNKILNNSAKYEIVPFEEISNYLQMYREENDLVGAVTNEGVAVETFLKKDDVSKICKHFESDYLIYTRVLSTFPKVSVTLFSASQKVNVIIDFRVWSEMKQDFSYIKRTTTKGSSTAVYAGIGSASRAVAKGLRRGLKEVEKDASKVRAAMND